MTFSEQLVYAMLKPVKYKEILELRARRAVLFVIVITMALATVTFAVPTAALITGFGGFEKLFKNRMAPLHYENGELEIERPFEMNIQGVVFKVDSTYESIPKEELRRDAVYFTIGSKELKIVIKAGSDVLEYDSLSLEYIFPEGLDNEMLCQAIPGIYVYLVIIFLFTMLGFFIKYGFLALIFSIPMNSLNKQRQMGLSYGKVFMLCFYGQTLGMIISNFTAALGIFDPTIVSIVCIFISIHMITKSFIGIDRSNQI